MLINSNTYHACNNVKHVMYSEKKEIFLESLVLKDTLFPKRTGATKYRIRT